MCACSCVCVCACVGKQHGATTARIKNAKKITVTTWGHCRTFAFASGRDSSRALSPHPTYVSRLIGKPTVSVPLSPSYTLTMTNLLTITPINGRPRHHGNQPGLRLVHTPAFKSSHLKSCPYTRCTFGCVQPLHNNKNMLKK